MMNVHLRTGNETHISSFLCKGLFHGLATQEFQELAKESYFHWNYKGNGLWVLHCTVNGHSSSEKALCGPMLIMGERHDFKNLMEDIISDSSLESGLNLNCSCLMNDLITGRLMECPFSGSQAPWIKCDTKILGNVSILTQNLWWRHPRKNLNTGLLSIRFFSVGERLRYKSYLLLNNKQGYPQVLDVLCKWRWDLSSVGNIFFCNKGL